MLETLLIVVQHNTLLSSVLLFVLGCWIFFARLENRRREPLAALLLYTSFWLLAYTLRVSASEPMQRLYWMRMEFFSASFMPVFCFMVTASMATGQRLHDRFVALLVAPNAFLATMIFAFPLAVVLENGRLKMGPAVPALWLQFLIMFGLSAVYVYRYWGNLSREFGTRLKAFIVGMFCLLGASSAVLFGGAYGLMDQVQWIGGVMAISAFAGLVIVSLCVDARELAVRLRPVLGEMLLLVAMLVFVLDVVLRSEAISVTTRLITMGAVIGYGGLSVRSLSRQSRDMDESERLRSSLTATNAALHETDLMKTRLLSFASHQLRAILAGIRGYVDMLYRGDFGQLTERQGEIMGVTLVAADRLGDTVDMFLDVAKIEGGRLRVDKKPIAFAGLVQRAVGGLVPLAQRKGLPIVRDVPEGLMVPVDQGKLYHAIVNLIHNAINYTDRGGIEVAVRADDEWLTLAVRDTGMGMDEKARQHVHELFNQGLSAVRFEESGGSGLGLYIAKAIVEAHGGQMIAESPGKGLGSTFGFRLPLK